ncbi:MAG: hypothetical protein AABY22_10555, partial [Nanoarchaeota archaeon]
KTYHFLTNKSRTISNFVVVILVLVALTFIYFYSVRLFLASFGGIIINLLFKNGFVRIKFIRDKIELLVTKFKEFFNTN